MKQELPRREFWKKMGAIGAAILGYVVIRKYLPPPELVKQININLKVKPRQ